eukprot:TRINITY_DN5270_c0_g1_i1.p1 TRINITY_DN5270_c0_g1~~TRINITY_DN5270_c0_g1_i1.p1  ORF type:complete len:461 (+),score=85.98 TRINITY_DN5270_c0_g1_i1:122-1504(+)
MDKESSPLLAGSNGSYNVYTSRWAMLGMLVLLQMSNAMLWLSFAPIVGIFQDYYECDVIMLDLTSLLFMIVSVPLGFAGTYILNKFGLRYSMVLAAWLNAAGAVIRYGGDYLPHPKQRLALVLLGQSVAAASQPVFLDSPTLLAARWFGEGERATANTIASVANPVGMAVASIITPSIVSDSSHMRDMLLVMAAPAVIGLVLVTLFFKSSPPTAPSASAHETHISYMDAVKQLAKNRAYVLLLLGFSVGIALVSSLTSLIGQLTAGEGYTADQAGLFGLALVGAGLLGAAVAGMLLDKYHCYLTVMKTAFVLAGGAVLMLIFADKPGNFPLMMVACCLLGMAAFAGLPTGLELCVEITYPINEGVSTGFIWIFSQALGVVLILSTNALKGEKVYYDDDGRQVDPSATSGHEYYRYPKALYMLAAITGVAAIAIMLIKTRYKRLEAEAAGTAYSVQDTAKP